jgi:hypothetical protein
MAQTISKTGAPVVELGVWVLASGNSAYQELMQQHADALVGGELIQTPEFDAMVAEFLAATNQEIAI